MVVEADGMSPGPGVRADPIVLLELRGYAIRAEDVLAAVEHPAAGGVTAFFGYVRAEDGGRPVRTLEYSAHPSAGELLRGVADRVAGAHPVIRLAAVHRVGRLAVGELAVAVAVGCAHRDAAFRATRQLIDEVKNEVPIWKHQVFTDGSQEWVGSG